MPVTSSADHASASPDGSPLIDAFVDLRRRLIAAAEAVPPGRRDVPFVGRWDLHDLIAHLIGWDCTNVDAVRDLLDGRLPAFYARYDPGWATYNAGLVRRHRLDDWPALVESLRRSQADLVALLSLPAGALSRDRGVVHRGRPVTIAAILRATLRDEAEHLRQIEAFAASQETLARPQA